MYPVVKSKKYFFLNERSAWTSAFIGNVLTVPLALLLKNQKFITPNAISIIGGIVFLIAATVYLFYPKHTLLCSAGFFLSYLLDSTDGKLARIKGVQSKSGALLDASIDLICHSFGLLIVGFAISKHSNSFVPIIIMFPYIMFLTYSHIRDIKSILKKNKKKIKKKFIPNSKWQKFCWQQGLIHHPYSDWEVLYICILIISINLQDPILFLFVSIYINLFNKINISFKKKFL
jgi:phosphatidylglycerophosphate synthase